LSDLSRKKTRERLPARREPYWQRLAEGAYLGFRRGPDTWIARFRGQDNKQQYHSLGEALEFDEAKRRAEAWLSQLSGSPVKATKRGTVREALEAYIADLRRHGREDAAKDAEGRFKSVVWKDELAAIRLEKLTLDDMLAWRDRLKEGREPRTINRHVRSVMAGLTLSLSLGHIGNPAAWKLKPLHDDKEDRGEAILFIDTEQRAELIKAAGTEIAKFLRALELTGARPNELAAAKVSDFDGSTVKFQTRKGKGAKLRTRYTVLGEEGVVFFTEQASNKPADSFLFVDVDGEQWTKHTWSAEARVALAAHNEKNPKTKITAATAYTFRHARISELLQIHKIDPLTVAQQTGTSLAMIEKNYFKFIPSAMRDKLKSVKS